jgi:hypothetical protein
MKTCTKCYAQIEEVAGKNICRACDLDSLATLPPTDAPMTSASWYRTRLATERRERSSEYRSQGLRMRRGILGGTYWTF